MAANELFDTGIKVTGSFSAAGAFPADAKSVVNTIAERDDHVTQNRAYDGMEVYVKEEKKKYRYVNGEWIELDKGADATDISFIAEYGETSYADIENQYNLNKNRIISMNASLTDTDRFATLSKKTASSFVFTTVDFDAIHRFTCKANGWTHEMKKFATTNSTSTNITDSEGNLVVDDDNYILVGDTDEEKVMTESAVKALFQEEFAKLDGSEDLF